MRSRILALLNTRTENVLELQHFEDLPLGEEWTTRRRTVTESDLAAFIGLSGDYNPLYTDEEHARAGQYGGRVAPGALIAALTSGLGSMDVPLPATVGLVGMSWKFMLPVQPGDTVVSRWRLSRKRNVENPRWGLAVWQVDVENQRGEVVATAELARLVAKREQPAERTGRSRRRRRKGAPAGQAAADVVMTEPVPEPAPADVPPPASRRRRRRGGGEPPPAETPEQPTPPAQPTAAEPSGEQPSSPFVSPEAPASAPRRRRRRRSSNGQEDGQPGAEGQPEAAPEAAPPRTQVEAAVPAGQPESSTGAPREPRPPEDWPGEAGSDASEAGGDPSDGGLGRVFRRLLRP